jgi:hypothetical protein
MIKNTSDEVFSKLPKEKGKEWIISMIEGVSYRDVEESRYDRPLKFNYDLENEQIYATKYFSSTFPYGRFKTRPDEEKARILNEVLLDILHELSHFYGIGNTEETDDISDEWANNFLKNGLNEILFCQKENDFLAIHAPSGMVFFKMEDMSHIYDSAEEGEMSENPMEKLKKNMEFYEDISFLETDPESGFKPIGKSTAFLGALVSLALNNQSNSSTRLEKYNVDKEESDGLSFESFKNENFRGVFSWAAGGAEGAVSRFDMVDVNLDIGQKEYTLHKSELLTSKEDHHGNINYVSFPLISEEVLLVNVQSSKTSHSLSILNLDEIEMDSNSKSEIQEKTSRQSIKTHCEQANAPIDNDKFM